MIVTLTRFILASLLCARFAVTVQYPEPNQLTLSPADYASIAEEQSSNANNNNQVWLGLLWFAIAYVAIGMIGVCVEFARGKTLSVSLMFVLFLIQGGLDFMDVSSDFVAAQSLLHADEANRCGWTQCFFPDFFTTYGQILFVCVAIGALATLVSAVLTMLQISHKVCGTDDGEAAANTKPSIKADWHSINMNIQARMHADSISQSQVDKVTKMEIWVTLFKLCCADLPALILYTSLWRYSWDRAGINISMVTVISFIITCVDIVYALLFLRLSVYVHQIRFCGLLGYARYPCGLLICTLLTALCVAIGLLVDQATADKFANSAMRVSVGHTCYDPYLYPGGNIWAINEERDRPGYETAYGVYFEDLVLLEANISGESQEAFSIRFSFVKNDEWNNVTSDWTADYIMISEFKLLEIGTDDRDVDETADVSIPQCDVKWPPYVSQSGIVKFIAADIPYGCHDTVWNCSLYDGEPVPYLNSTVVQFCIDVCEWS